MDAEYAKISANMNVRVRNSNGVTIYLNAVSVGEKLTLVAEGVEIKFKKAPAS